MTGFIKYISLAMLILSAGVPQLAQAEIEDISSAINKAGRQRMLSQRIVATYSQLGMNIQSWKSKEQFDTAIKLFETQLKELKKYRPAGDINKQLTLVEELWVPMRVILQEPVDKNRVQELRKQAEVVLGASHRVVLMLEQEANSKSGRLVNLAGRQRMLAQRISSLYMLQSWGFKDDEYIRDYSRAVSEFRQALNELKSSPANTMIINNKLNEARKQFSMLEKSARQKNGEYIPLMVKMSADKLLMIMNDITQEYDELTKSELVSAR